jgi:glucan biosynthesis protein
VPDHDNIVTYWTPQEPIRADEHRFAYRLTWGDGPARGRRRLRLVRAGRCVQIRRQSVSS